MKQLLLIFLCTVFVFQANAAAADLGKVTINGIAPGYLGSEITVSVIEDYFSDVTKVVARSTVQLDSTFKFTFKIDQTQKVVIQSKNNKAYLYVQKDAVYDVYLPERDPYLPPVKSGSIVELTFFGLDETDINFQILAFQRWNDEYMSRYYKLKDTDPGAFAQKLDTFKMYVEKYYKESDDIFLTTFVRFSIAELDEIQFAGMRNRYEKYDFYIKPSPVFYKNDAYMSYIKRYYKNLIPRLHNKTNVQVYDAILKASPTLLMKALGTEYSLGNLRIREMIMIKSLSEVFYSDDYPQTNIMTILDSLSNNCLFDENETIAQNVKFRLTDLVPGGLAPKFTIATAEGLKTHYDYRGQHLYLHFFDPTVVENLTEIDLLRKLHEEYGEYVQFVSLAVSPKSAPSDTLSPLPNVPWEMYPIELNDELLDKFKIRAYPSYVMVDAAGYIVAAPALGPTPNSKYETIDKTMFYIRKYLKENPE